MLAIRCLDEGVDVPAISHGIVLSSSKTKREFIQRRGRMLRKSPGKELAHIYDALTFPAFDASDSATKIVIDELQRAYELSAFASNAESGVKIRLEFWMEQYGIDPSQVFLERESDEASIDNVGELEP